MDTELSSELAENLLRPAALLRPDYLIPSEWIGHIPFTFWLIDAV